VGFYPDVGRPPARFKFHTYGAVRGVIRSLLRVGTCTWLADEVIE
jgi:hypothetical protein